MSRRTEKGRCSPAGLELPEKAPRKLSLRPRSATIEKIKSKEDATECGRLIFQGPSAGISDRPVV
jgi:hypothetical protein